MKMDSDIGLDIMNADRGVPSNGSGQYRWAVVSFQEKPGDSTGLRVVKVLELVGHEGPVKTWDGKTWKHVHGPVVGYRRDARKQKKEATQRLGIHKVNASEFWGGIDGDWGWGY